MRVLIKRLLTAAFKALFCPRSVYAVIYVLGGVESVSLTCEANEPFCVIFTTWCAVGSCNMFLYIPVPFLMPLTPSFKSPADVAMYNKINGLLQTQTTLCSFLYC